MAGAPTSDVTTTPTICHVVQVWGGAASDERTEVRSAACATLDAQTTQALIEIAPIGRGIRSSAQALRDKCRESHWPGIVLWCVHEREPHPVPAPVPVPFEPLILDDKNPRLRDWVAGLVGATALRRRRSIRSALWQLLSVRWLLPAIAVLASILALCEALGGRWLHAATHLSFALVATLSFITLREVWWIVPGGIVERATGIRRRHGAIRLFTRGDCVAVVSGATQHWVVYLCGQRAAACRTLSDIELIAFLAAWQSPLAPPPLEQLSDFL